MTTEPTTTTDNPEHDQDQAGTLVHVDPHLVEIGENVRDSAALDAEFVSSIAESGVLVPVTATRADDGTITIRDGQRRTLAARQAGRATIPVYLIDADGSDTVERITHQIVTNDHRTELTAIQRTNGINQLLLAGVSVTKVAKKLSLSRDTVKAAKTVADAPNTKQALSGGQLTLTEAAAVAEFDDDPEALAELVAVAGTGRFDHKVAELRQRRADERAYHDAVDHYSALGYTIVEDMPRYGDTDCVELRYLRTGDGEGATTEAVADPAHWAVRLLEEEIYVDTATGEVVPDSEIDWQCSGYGGVSLGPRDGLRHPDSVTEKVIYAPEWYCTDYAAAGLTLCETLAKRVEALAREADATAATSETGAQDDATDVYAREAARKEQQTQERRKVIALNRLGEAAQLVRREFIAEKLLTRKTPPKGAAAFVARVLTRDPRLIDEHHGCALTLAMLGTSDIAADAANLPANGDARAQVLTLALVLGALEARTPKDAWRGSTVYYNGNYVGPAELLAFLAANGYQLADVEKVITGELDAATAYTTALTTSSDANNDAVDDNNISEAS